VLMLSTPSGATVDALGPTERQALQDVNYALKAVETRRLKRSGYSLEAQIPSRKLLPPLPLVIGASFLAGVLIWATLRLIRRRAATGGSRALNPAGEDRYPAE